MHQGYFARLFGTFYNFTNITHISKQNKYDFHIRFQTSFDSLKIFYRCNYWTICHCIIKSLFHRPPTPVLLRSRFLLSGIHLPKKKKRVKLISNISVVLTLLSILQALFVLLCSNMLALFTEKFKHTFKKIKIISKIVKFHSLLLVVLTSSFFLLFFLSLLIFVIFSILRGSFLIHLKLNVKILPFF